MPCSTCASAPPTSGATSTGPRPCRGACWRRACPRLVTAPSTPIVLIDEDGSLSELARPTLAAMGYTDVRVLAGGLSAWRAGDRPTVQGLNVPSKVFGERALHEFKTPQVSCPELAQRLATGDDMVIVDSRTPEEYHRGCIPGAWSMPGGELVLRIGEVVARPDQTIVVHCGGRTRSYIGAESLRRMGLPNPIIALENGTMGWQLAGLELERGAERWAPAPSSARPGGGRRGRAADREERRPSRRDGRRAKGHAGAPGGREPLRLRRAHHRGVCGGPSRRARCGRPAARRCRPSTTTSPCAAPRSSSSATTAAGPR